MNRRKMLALLIGSVVFSLGGRLADGGLITWEFAGQITEVRDIDGSLGGVFNIGTLFSGQYTFESTTPDSSPSPDVGRYEGAVTSVFGIIGEVPFFDFPGLEGLIRVSDNFGGDSYSVIDATEFLGAPVEFSLFLNDSTGAIFSGDSLLFTPPALSALDSTFFLLELEPDGDALIGELTILIPEPGTLVLMVVGASLLIWMKR